MKPNGRTKIDKRNTHTNTYRINVESDTCRQRFPHRLLALLEFSQQQQQRVVTVISSDSSEFVEDDENEICCSTPRGLLVLGSFDTLSEVFPLSSYLEIARCFYLQQTCGVVEDSCNKIKI